MVSVKRSKAMNLLLAVPLLLSAAGGILQLWPVMIAACLLVPAAVLAAPVCRTFENMWSYLLTFFVMPAPGITAALQLRDRLFFWRDDTVLWIATCVILYFGILGAAEILAGSLIRRLRRQQRGFLKKQKQDIVNFL